VTEPRRDGESDESWSSRDPILRMRRYLEARGLASPERDELLVSEVRSDVERALGEAFEAPRLGSESLFDDVYASAPWHLQEQREAARTVDAEASPSPSAGAEG